MNKVFVVTGGSTGIGASVTKQLSAQNAQVINVDIKNADIEADLSCHQDRLRAINSLESRFPEGIDGLVTCAGLGPNAQPVELITQVNYHGSITLVEGLKHLLAKKQGNVVLVSSNAAVLPGLDEALAQAIQNESEQDAIALAATRTGPQNYAASKNALIKWMKKHAPDYIQSKINLNAIAPGITKTPLTDKAFTDKAFGEAMQQFLQMTPYGDIATPDMIAKPITFLLSEGAEFMVGSVIFVDGGVDAALRPLEF